MSGFIRFLCAAVLTPLLFACDGSAVIGSDRVVPSGQSAVPDNTEESTEAPVAVLSTQASVQDDAPDNATQPPAATAQPQPESTPPAPQKTYTPADITDLILVTGQSNALGAQTAYDANLDVPHNRAFAFTNNGWMQADLHQVWDRNWFPRSHPDGDPSNNFAFHMARHMAQQDPTRVVGFILITDPGKRIENWALHGEFWQSIDARVLDAINQLPHKSQLDGILWHQGESNAGESDYHEKLYQLINRFREQTWYSWGKPFICGETVAYQLINSQLMALNANGDAWTGCVAGSDLTTQTDGYHFDAPALREIGRRYAAKYLAMTR